jgi:hypothetical protein
MDYKTVMVSLALDRLNHACLAVSGVTRHLATESCRCAFLSR